MPRRTPVVLIASAATLAAAFAAAPATLAAQSPHDVVTAAIDARQAHYQEIEHRIWQFAEVGYQEDRSSALLEAELRDAGFSVETGVAGMPTAFVASYGSGEPVIAVLAEYDALPGMSQAAVPERQPVTAHAPGHACGHHLLGTAATAAGIAVKTWLAQSGHTGTIRVYGTPAEESGSGKVYMTRAGLFDDVDAVITWHPGDRNDAGPATTLAIKSAKFRFHGVAAHAAAAPDRGRSALDAVEAMDYMVNLMREHTPDFTRIHYVITDGGGAPNVAPDFAEVYYYVRHPDAEVVKELFDRVVQAAEGAARGTGTTMDYEVVGGSYSKLPNEALARAMDANLRAVGGVQYDAGERGFAEQVRATLGDRLPPLSNASGIQPFGLHATSASTDAGDVSWAAPLTSLTTATWVPGTPAHSWQAVAAGGMSIGAKGMLVAARTLARTATDLFTDPDLVAAARAEFQDRRGPDFHYEPLLGDRQPALNYRGGR